MHCVDSLPYGVQLCNFADCGTNFVGAHNELQSYLKEMDEGAIQSYLAAEGCDWIFNPLTPLMQGAFGNE